MLIVVRILQGAGLGALATLTPVYLAECSTAAKRGMLTGLHGFFLVSGYNISSWVGFGCYYSTNLTFGWRGPIAFTCIPALLLTIGKQHNLRRSLGLRRSSRSVEWLRFLPPTLEIQY